MTDMTDPTIPPEKKSRRGMLLLGLAVMLACGGGYGVAKTGIWSPLAMLAPSEAEVPAEPTAVFVTLPTVVLTLPGPQNRSLVLGVKIETDAQHVKNVEYLQPRILDAFNTFLSEIDPFAFERRGILEIIRNEMVTRVSFILGKEAFSDILITEFRIQ